MELTRRSIFGGLLALAAPAIIRTPGLLMPVKALPIEPTAFTLPRGLIAITTAQEINDRNRVMYGYEPIDRTWEYDWSTGLYRPEAATG